MAAPALQVAGVHRGFGGVRVLRGVDLVVEADELVALVGENGAGKTTLVRCIAGGMAVDDGTVEVLGSPVVDGVPDRQEQVDVVWQDLSLCDNLDVTDNLFLGREPSWLLPSGPDRQHHARGLLEQLGVHLPDLARSVASLSGGQRQSVALARTLVRRPELLILDEPTAALGSAGVGALEQLIRRMRAAGTAILLISHDLDLVCQVADRALVLRGGVITADVRRPNLSADELRARISGLEGDAHARRQLHGLRSLVDQMGGAHPSAVLPMIVSAVSVALDQPRMALHLRTDDPAGSRLELAAGLGLAGPLRTALAVVELGTGAPAAQAVTRRTAIVAADLRLHPDPATAALLPLGVRSTWTVPLVGGSEVIGTLSGFGDAHGVLPEGALELAALYASHAAAALERDRLLTTVTRRNRTLETLRQVLETLAGSESHDSGLAVALEALRLGLGAAELVLLELPTASPTTATTSLRRLATSGGHGDWVDSVQIPPTGEVTSVVDRAGATILAATVAERALRRALVARWMPGDAPRQGAHELLVDGAHSVLLALERRAHDAARQEAATLRRSTDMQRTFLSRLSHELRTPLTAIHGYADTLRQPDVSWDDSTTRRFLDTIACESERLGQLVTDLLDASAIEGGVLQLQLDWCELPLVVERAVACVPVPAPGLVDVDVADGLPPIRADHDRLEQALVNLIGNAVTHTPAGTRTTVTAAPAGRGHVELVVADDGPGLPDVVTAAMFVAGVRGDGAQGGAGLGLAITRGIVAAHGGTVRVDSTSAGTTFRVRLPIDGPPHGNPGWALAEDGRHRGSPREAKA